MASQFNTSILLFALALIIVLMALLFVWWRFMQQKKMQVQLENVYQLQLAQYKQQLDLEKISRYFTTSLIDAHHIDGVLADVSNNLLSQLRLEDSMIYLWNDDKTMLIQKAGYGEKGDMSKIANKAAYNIAKGKGIIGAAAEADAPLIVNDTSNDNRYMEVDNIVRRSEICVPIYVDGQQAGMINSESSQLNFFTDWHLQLFTTIAALIGNKIKVIEEQTKVQAQQLALATARYKVATTELALLRSQMNPHFIFNSLNSVQKYIWENKEEDAAEYLASFAKLMRAILENSRKEWITIAQESDILKLYVNLEHRRSNYNFNYSISIADTIDLNTHLIPPMLLQPFIENAIWHGLNKKKAKGNLQIGILKTANNLVCTVQDDGVGRHAQHASSSGVGEKKSMGISITQQRIEQLIEQQQQLSTVHIDDLTHEGKAAGTKVTVTLPLKLRSHA